MKSKRLLLLLLMALIAPWAMNAQNSIPFNEGFESMTSVDDLTAAGWTLSTTESGTFLAIETGASNVYEGSKSLNLDAWNVSSSSSVQYLGLPLVAGDLNTLQISFAYKVTSGTINVGYLTDATDFSTFTSLAQYSSSSSFTVKTTDLSAAPTNAARLVLKYTGWYRCYLDNFEVKAIPSCQAATSITASDITATSATIAWEGEGNTWNLKYNGIEVNGISAMSYNLTSLTDGTNYTVSVQNVCSDGTTTDWISTTFRTPEICPDGKICIGEGTTTSTYLPANNYYNYSLTQQIYTADEIGEAGAILSIDFFKASTITMAVDLDIYMVLTEKDEFESATDFIPVTASDLVFSGTVTFADNAWTTIELDNPFVYDGTSNVAIMVDNNTGDYVSSTPFYVFTSDKNQALYAQNDNTNFDPFAPAFSSRTAQKNRIRLAIGEPPACPKPTGLTVNYTGGTEATISWTSDATAWNMRVNGTEINGTITNPYTLTGLELATTYEVEVQANCGADGESEWVGPVSFTTDACMPEDQIVVNYALTDSYGDDWNGNYILVVDESCNIVEMLTIESGNSASGTLRVCGSFVQFLWYAGNYPGETSWVFTDNAGNVLFEGAGSADMATLDVLYTIDNNPYSAPTDVAVSEVGPRSAKLSWTETGTATAWQILLTAGDDEEGTIIDANSNPFVITGLTPETEYFAQVRSTGANGTSIWTCLGADFTTEVPCPNPTNLNVTAYPTSADVAWEGFADAYDLEWALLPASESKDALWLQYDNGTMATTIGNGTTQYEWTWGVMYPASMLAGNGMLSKISIYETAQYNTQDITINVYTGGDEAPETLVYTETVTPAGVDGFHEITFAEPVTIDPTQNLWITLTETGYYVIAACQGTESNNDWVDNGGWAHIGDLSASLAGYNWMIRGYVEPAYDPSTLEWNPVSGITSPYTIEGLQSEKTYIVRVKAVCGGEDGESGWTTVTFKTPSACDMPINLAANDITYNSAKLSWTGYQESYNVRYRSLAKLESVTLTENFDEGMGDWTTIDADGDGYIWVSSMNPGDYHNAGVDLTGNGHNGSAQFVISGSYSNSLGMALTPDNYLVSPQIELGGGMEFWVKAQAAGYFAEHFGVAVSTSGNTDAAAFTTIAEWTLEDANDWYKYTVDLSAYTGQGYVAIRHFDCTDQFILNLDDITIGTIVPTSAWTTVTVNEPTYTLTGLTAQTQYEWQVQGVNASCGELEWSEIVSFNTIAGCYWTAEDYPNSMFMVGVVQIDGVEQASPVLELGAFCNGECRGSEFPVEEDGRWLYFMVIGGNDGDEITFRLYDHALEQELNLYCFNVIPFEIYGLIGIDEPYEVLFSNPFTISADVNPIGAGTVTGLGEYWPNSTATLTATANQGYAFNSWTLDGEVVSTEPTYTFTVIEPVNLTANFDVVQTYQLTAGENWWSTYLEITLDDLKAALVEALPNTVITIKSKGQNTKYNNGRWSGQLTSLDPTQMYCISVSTACEITVKGTPINYAEHPITIIGNGITWLGFPLSENMFISDALAGFPVVNGDIIKSKTNNAIYNRGAWRGALTTFESGKGYKFLSNGMEDRTLTFPAGTK